MRTFPAPATPDADPIPWLTDEWRAAGCFSSNLSVAIETIKSRLAMGRDVGAFSPEAIAITAVVDSVKSTVGGLHNDSAPYGVLFGRMAGVPAGTDLDTKIVHIGADVLTDKALTEGQRAAVMTGLVMHEVGHIRYSIPLEKAVLAKYRRGTKEEKRVALVANIGDDCYIDPTMQSTFGGLRVALDTAMWWVNRGEMARWAKDGRSIPTPALFDSTDNRLHSVVLLARYPWTLDLSKADPEKVDFILDWVSKIKTEMRPAPRLALVESMVTFIWPEGLEPSPEGDGDGEGEPKPSKDGKGKPSGKASPHRDLDHDDQPEGKDKGDSPDGESNESEGDGEGDSDDSSPDGDEEGDGEGEGSGSPDSKSGDEESPAKPGGASSTGHGGDKVPEAPSCFDARPMDKRSDDLAAQQAVASHVRAKKGADSIRRYPSPKGDSTWFVRGLRVKVGEKTLARRAKETRIKDFAVAHKGKGGKDKPPDSLVESAGEGFATSRRGIGYGYVRTNDDAGASAAFAAAINSARRGPGSPERMVKAGRIDRSRLARVSQGDARVFIARSAAAPQRVRASILVDASGSMAGEYRIGKACQVARNLAMAFESLEWARGRVYAHTTDDSGTVVYPLWKSGQPRESINDADNIDMAGNFDGYAIAYVADELLEELKPSERGLIIVISDGAPAGPPSGYDGIGENHVREVVATYRRQGLRIISISVDPSLDAAQQTHMYGKDVVAYDNSPTALARSLARVIGSSI